MHLPNPVSEKGPDAHPVPRTYYISLMNVRGSRDSDNLFSSKVALYAAITSTVSFSPG